MENAAFVGETLQRYQTSQQAWPHWRNLLEAGAFDQLIGELRGLADPHDRHVQSRTLLRQIYFNTWDGKSLDIVPVVTAMIVENALEQAQQAEAAQQWWREEAARVSEQTSRILAIGWSDGLMRSTLHFNEGERWGLEALRLWEDQTRRLRNLAESHFYLALHQTKLGKTLAAAENMGEALSRYIEIEMRANRPVSVDLTQQLDLLLSYALLAVLDRDDTEDGTLSTVKQRLNELLKDGEMKEDVQEAIVRLRLLCQELASVT